MSADKQMPREKAMEFGIESLNNGELLALIIKSAYRDRNVFELVDDILEKAGGFENLLSLTFEELVNIKGIKTAKAFEILAILEIAKRLSKVEILDESVIDNPGKVAEWLRYTIGYKDTEEFFVIYLNSRNVIIRYESLFKGSSKESVVGIDTLLRKAILLKSSGIIIAHNHPSGIMMPSDQDLILTRKIKEALSMFDIKLIDHIIVSGMGSFSFEINGLL